MAGYLFLEVGDTDNTLSLQLIVRVKYIDRSVSCQAEEEGNSKNRPGKGERWRRVTGK
jgi:hypothetical protein